MTLLCRRYQAVTLALLSVLAILARARAQPSSYGPWEIRRARTSDAHKAGGYPEWDVAFSGPAECPDVRIDERTGGSRGVIHIGRRILVPQQVMLYLDGSYTTECELDHRSGALSLSVFRPEDWDALGRTPHTDVRNALEDQPRPLWTWSLHRMTDSDVLEPAPIPLTARVAMGGYVATCAGKPVVLALSWLGAHTCRERARLHGLRLMEVEPVDPMDAVFEDIDLGRDELAPVHAALVTGNRKAAMQRLVDHFRRRLARPAPTALTRSSFAEVDAALHNRFRSIGSDRYFELDREFSWSRNAIDDREWLLHFQWHYILRALLEAGVIRGDERYTRKAIELIRDWIPKNHPGSPWSWRTLEVSLRAMVWRDIYPYLVHAAEFTLADHAAFLHTLAAHLDYLLPEERFHSGHNFGATECKALLSVGLLMPEFADAPVWVDTAWKRLEREMTEQVLADGAQKELTCGYHNGVTNTFYSMAQLAREHGLAPSDHYWAQLERMHEYTMYLTKPDGTQPNLGDTWGSRQDKLVRRGGVAFSRPDMLFVASRGVEGSPPATLDTRLPAAGYYVVRTGWTNDPDALYVLLDAAHHWGGWHQHYDALQLILYAYGRTLLPDAGPFAYDHPDRPQFRSTAYHSTVTVDDSDQNTSPCVLNACRAGQRLSFLDAEHSGWHGIVHRRQVIVVKCPPLPYVLVVDRVAGEGRRRLDQHFHLPPGDVATDPDAMAAWTTAPETGNLLLRAAWTDGLVMTVEASAMTAGYGRRITRPDVRFSRSGALPGMFVTLLLPFPGTHVPVVTTAVETITPDGSALLRVNAPEWSDTHLVNRAPPGEEPRDMSAPGTVAFVRRHPDGSVHVSEILHTGTDTSQ